MKHLISMLCTGLCAVTHLYAYTGNKDTVTVNYAAIAGAADLDYARPVLRSEEGMPLGNGRMGTLVWTVPSSLKFQLNRVDVFGNSSASNSFFERNTDYCGGTGYMDVDFGQDVFSAPAFHQHLSCYEGLSTISGRNVSARGLIWEREDVLALEISDRRTTSLPVTTELRMLRMPVARTGSHVATSRLRQEGDYIILTQEFREDGYYCSSALVAAVSGRPVEAEQNTATSVRLRTLPGGPDFTIYSATAASFDPSEDVVKTAIGKLEAARKKGFAALLNDNRDWWRKFWQRSYIQLHSDDGQADYVAQHYAWYLYIMGSSSRGKYPVKFNGMLWSTNGDERKWGHLYWGANQSCLYNALFQTNHTELLDPMFDMYSRAYDSYALAARQQWGSKGIYIPETTGFDNTPALPDSIAGEMRDLYLVRKPWEQRSQSFKDYAYTQMPFLSRWNWKKDEGWKNGRWHTGSKSNSTFGHVSHIFSRGAKIAYQYWLRYEYTQDTAWLRQRAYPMLKGVAEFYRNFPNVRKEKDGRYHIYHINDNESIWDGHNTVEEISAMRGIFPVVIKAARLLQTDNDMLPVWQEFLDHLSPLPQVKENGKTTWSRSLLPVLQGNPSWHPDGNTMPVWFFDLCTLESDRDIQQTGNDTYNTYFDNGIDSTVGIYVLSKLPATGALLGRPEAVQYLVPNQLRRRKNETVLANRMDLSEGYQTTNVQRLGRAAEALQLALCQSVPAGPGQENVIHVFPAWPRSWDAQYALLCRGGFVVTSAMKQGDIPFVKLEATQGGVCKIRNPWKGTVALYRQGKKTQVLKGELLSFATAKGEEVTLQRER